MPGCVALLAPSSPHAGRLRAEASPGLSRASYTQEATPARFTAFCFFLENVSLHGAGEEDARFPFCHSYLLVFMCIFLKGGALKSRPLQAVTEGEERATSVSGVRGEP